jgi:hypothetical protein
MGWLPADARPSLVKAIVAMEPIGPPFLDNTDLGLSLPWGITAAPMTLSMPPYPTIAQAPALRLLPLRTWATVARS